MCISDISASISTNFGDLTTVQLSQSVMNSLHNWPWRPISADGNASCSVFYISESVQSKDRNNDCVDFLYLFLGSGSSANNIVSRKIHTDDGFDFICDDEHKILKWLSGNTAPSIGNEFVHADDVFVGTRLVSWMNDIYQYVTVTSLSFQTQEESCAVNWLTTLTNSYQLENGIVVKGFTGDVCSCAPSASIHEIPCNSTMSFCVSNSFSLNLSGSESLPNTTKTWTVTDFDGTELIPQTSESATALDGNLNLSIDPVYGCCTCSIRIDLTHMHDSASAFFGNETVAGFTGPRGQMSKIQFIREDLAGFATFSSPAPPGFPSMYAGINQFWAILTLSGSGGPQNGPEIFNPNMGTAQVAMVVPTGSNVEGSVDNMVEHINASSSHPTFAQWFSDVSASKHGTTDLVLQSTTMGDCSAPHLGGKGWSAYYINWRYFDDIGGVATGTPEAGTGNLGSGDGFLLGAHGTQTFPGNTMFVSGSLKGSISASLSFTRSGCFPSNLPQQLNVCYEEALSLGSGLEATSSCCFLLQLNKQPSGNGSASYCQPTFTPVICLDDVLAACNYDTIEYNASSGGSFDLSEKERCKAFVADQSTMANGFVILSFTASTSNSLCLNNASGQPSMSQGHNPESVLTPDCCPAYSQSTIVYFNPGLGVGGTARVQCYPTMSLNASSIFGTVPTIGAYTWSITGGNGSPAPHAIPGFNGNVATDEIYLEGGNLLAFNNATSHSADAEAYLLHETASGLYTASVSIMNGPCEYSASVFIKMVSASADAGPDIDYCQAIGSDGSLRMDAVGVPAGGIWSVVSPLPPAPQPVIGSLTSPNTKISQDPCTSYTYEWTINSGSFHIINEDTYSILCQASDQVTVNTFQDLASGSILGVHTASGGGLSHPAIVTSNPQGGLLYSTNIFTNTLDFSPSSGRHLTFKGTIDQNATEATWSVYMSGSHYNKTNNPYGSSSYMINFGQSHQGMMGQFAGPGTMFWPYLYSGQALTSQSVGGAAPGQGEAAQNRINIVQGLNPPTIGSHRFYFSSSTVNTFNSKIPLLLSQNSDCQCPDLRAYSHGWITFKPNAPSDALKFIIPGVSTGVNSGLMTSNGSSYTTPAPVAGNFVYEPFLSMSVPKYQDAVAIAFHSGSNFSGPSSMSSVLKKNGKALPAPFLTFSYDPGSGNIPTPAITPLQRKNSFSDNDSSFPNPNASAPYWPSHDSPSVSIGTSITSGSGETLSWRWKARQIAAYRAGIQLPLTVLGGTITGSFTDTMTSESFVEAPGFFPPVRDLDVVPVWPASEASSTEVHRPYDSYGNFNNYDLVHSCSVMFEVTMSRLDAISSQVLQTYYASCSIMFCHQTT